ncbi:MAG: hypothetical protein IK140_03750 [Clostridia bacterium]|nr:hypothetical protein [Clostridia bacterium]
MKYNFISSGLVLNTIEPIYPRRGPFSGLCNRFSVFVKILRDFSGAKTARNDFLFPVGKLAFAKIAPLAGIAGPAE